MKHSLSNEKLQQDHLVAYIDLLGWKSKLLSAKTYKDIAPLLMMNDAYAFDYKPFVGL